MIDDCRLSIGYERVRGVTAPASFTLGTPKIEYSNYKIERNRGRGARTSVFRSTQERLPRGEN